MSKSPHLPTNGSVTNGAEGMTSAHTPTSAANPASPTLRAAMSSTVGRRSWPDSHL
jgi:hypothetical protein